MTRLPDFRLETYFSRWEFTARHDLTASDAQTMTMAELLGLADSQDRHAWETLDRLDQLPRPAGARPP